MSALYLTLACLAAATGAATAAVYLNFSARIMPRLAALGPAEGLGTMQDFNRRALRPPFMAAFFGSAAASVALLVLMFFSPASPGVALGGLGAGLSLLGFLITMAYNVPRNEALDRLDPAAAASAAPWATYQRQWSGANTVRAWCAAAGTLALLAAVALGILERV